MKISVVIPAFNRAHTLSRVIDSFIVQTYKNWECIIVDDFSTDETSTLVQSYIKKDKRIKYILNTHCKGAQGARNYGITKAKGEWIALFDSDDYAYPNFLEELSKKISDGVDVVTSSARMIDINTNQVIAIANWCAEGNILKQLLQGEVYVGYNGTLIKKTSLEEIGYTDTKCLSHQEYDTHIRLSKNCKYASTGMVLSDYYLNSSDTISVDKTRHYEGYTYILLKHRWSWREHSWTSLLIKTRNIFFSKDVPIKIKTRIRIKLLLYIPELFLYIIYFKIKKLVSN